MCERFATRALHSWNWRGLAAGAAAAACARRAKEKKTANKAQPYVCSISIHNQVSSSLAVVVVEKSSSLSVCLVVVCVVLVGIVIVDDVTHAKWHSKHARTFHDLYICGHTCKKYYRIGSNVVAMLPSEREWK